MIPYIKILLFADLEEASLRQLGNLDLFTTTIRRSSQSMNADVIIIGAGKPYGGTAWRRVDSRNSFI